MFQGIGLSWAPNVWHQESQRGDELLTLQRASLGQRSAFKIWPIGTIYLCSLLGGGVALNPTLRTKRALEGGLASGRATIWRLRARIPLPSLPLPVSFSHLHWTSGCILTDSCQKDRDERSFSLHLPRENWESVFLRLKENYLRFCNVWKYRITLMYRWIEQSVCKSIILQLKEKS